jgi:hypothetical protein
MDMFYDGDGCTSVSLAALGVLGQTSDEAMRSLNEMSDVVLVEDTPESKLKEKRLADALSENPLRHVERFNVPQMNGFIQLRSLEFSGDDIQSALEMKHGTPNVQFFKHQGKTKWWKDTNPKHGYIVVGELNGSYIGPKGVKTTWEDIPDLGVDNDNTSWKHVIAVKGGRFYCKNVQEWLPNKYLWLSNSGLPVRTKSRGEIINRGFLKVIHGVYQIKFK